MPDFPIWPQCNIACIFCSNPVEGYRETTDRYSFPEIKRKLEEYKGGLRTFVKFDEVRDYFNLTGGEPTAHPEFLRILALIRTEFPDTLIRLLSNGRMFFYDDFARRTCGIGGLPFEIAVPMFGRDPKSHESISRTPDSFRQTTQGLRNLEARRKPGQVVEIRVIMTRLQERHLDGLVDFLLSDLAWVDRVVFLFEEMEGFAEKYRDVLKFTQTDCARAIDRNFDKLRKLREVRLYHFSLCTVPERMWPWVWNTLAGFKITYLEGCRTRCLYRSRCLGVHRSYVKHMGAPDIVPITEPRAANFSGDPYHPVADARPV